jgi:nucleotide-binding universal stress UspA family protein
MVINKEEEDVAPQSELHPKISTKQKYSDLSLQTILVGIDFSTICKTALDVAEGMAQIYGSEIILTHVVNPVSAPSPDAEALFTAPELGQAMAEDLERLSQQI